MTRLGRLLDRLTDGCAVIASLSLALMLVHICADLLSRNLFNWPLPGTIEIVQSWYMVPIAFLPLALAERAEQHIVIEIVSQRLRIDVQRWLRVVASLLSAAYFSLIAWVCWGSALKKMAEGEYQRGPAEVVIWPTRFAIPLGCALLALVLIAKASRLARARREEARR